LPCPAVRFTEDVCQEDESRNYERRSVSYAGSSGSEAPEVLCVELGLLKMHHIYQASAAKLDPGAEINRSYSTSPSLTAAVCSDGAGADSALYLQVRTS
jgi:hypothetical protein